LIEVFDLFYIFGFFAKKLESCVSLALWERWRAEGVTERDTGIANIPIPTSFRGYTNLLFSSEEFKEFFKETFDFFKTEKAVSKLSSAPNYEL